MDFVDVELEDYLLDPKRVHRLAADGVVLRILDRGDVVSFMQAPRPTGTEEDVEMGRCYLCGGDDEIVGRTAEGICCSECAKALYLVRKFEREELFWREVFLAAFRGHGEDDYDGSRSNVRVSSERADEALEAYRERWR